MLTGSAPALPGGGAVWRVERKAAVESLAIAALVIELAGNRRVEAEERARNRHGNQACQESVHPAAASPRKQDERRDENGGRQRFRVGAQAEQHGGGDRGPGARQARFGRDFLVQPQEVREGHDREIEDFRHQEDAVDRQDRRAHECRGKCGGARRCPLRRQEGVRTGP